MPPGVEILASAATVADPRLRDGLLELALVNGYN
jgi:hypothetical protein